MDDLPAVRPRTRSSSSRGRAIVLIPLAIVGIVLVGVALMADSKSPDTPNSLTIDKYHLKDLTKDTNDLYDYPKWSKTQDQINNEPSINHGLWAYYKGPPFLQRVTLYSGNDRDLTKGGELVRRILGLPLNFGKWEGNHYLDNFETQQMYFLQSNEHSTLVIPPLEQSFQPILSDRAKQMLHHYISVGHNTIIVTGGTGSVDFINKNLIVEGYYHYCSIPPFFFIERLMLTSANSFSMICTSDSISDCRNDDPGAGMDARPIRETGA
jgi:hypothetical protein